MTMAVTSKGVTTDTQSKSWNKINLRFGQVLMFNLMVNLKFHLTQKLIFTLFNKLKSLKVAQKHGCMTD